MTKTYFSKLKHGDVFQPPGHPEYRCLKVDRDCYMSLSDGKLHLDDDMEYFADCGEIFTYDDMFVEIVYEDGEWEIVSREERAYFTSNESYKVWIAAFRIELETRLQDLEQAIEKLIRKLEHEKEER